MARKKKSSVTVNFKGVESKRKLLPEGDYPIRVAEVTKDKSSNDNDQLVFVFETYDCDQNGAKLWMHCPLTEASLWKLRSVLECLGVEVPDDELDIDLAELVDLTMMGVVHHETYDGQKRAKLVDFFADDEEEEEDDEDEEDADDESEDEDEDEEEEETPEERKKRLRRERRAARKKKEAEEDEDDDEDEDEEEEEKPKRKSSKKSTKKSSTKKTKKKAAGVSADDVQDMDEDALEELIEEHELDVDLSKFKTLRKKQAATIDALEDADLLADD